ncbi:MAG TPA: HD domain-containing protein [Methanospirillum sp.]|uniref:HD domain-containing protein n=1 Tax=Methanospirillum sp. TaxID=45200 RepID=UPI002D05802E|nr:HD domain-containing protein [Methanospirillum sp.]HWQ63396.1 HD domain-containing protein [Methanospirillum sp.]
MHGYIQVEPELLPLVDSPEIQRLRYVRQLGFSFLVYPGAHHTRFEHSLGAMHLASLMSRQIGLAREEHLLVTSAALLHDIGHGPFSHAIEGIASEALGRSHTDVRDLITRSSLGDELERIDIDPTEVCLMIEGNHPLASIIHGDLDVDRMDYLLRDAHYTGVPYGTVDSGRLIRATRLYGGGIVLDESGVQAAESLLIARTLMRPAVYYHHVSRIAEKIFSTAVYEQSRADPTVIMERMVRMDDAACMQTLLHSEYSDVRHLAEDLYYRRLFKRSLYLGKEEVSSSLRQSEDSNVREREFAVRIAEQAGVMPREVLVDIPAFPRDMYMQVQVQDRDNLLPLEDVSPLVTTLNETRRTQWRIGVYAPEHAVDEVRKAARELLHIRPLTRQDRLL